MKRLPDQTADPAQNMSGLEAGDLTFAPRRQLCDKRAKDLKDSLEAAKTRLTPSEYNAFMEVYKELKNPPLVSELLLPAHGWAFRNENAEEKAVPDEEVNRILRIKPISVYSNQGRQNLAREQRRMGPSGEEILIGNFIAFKTNYLPNEQKRQEFWLGKVIEVDGDQEMVRIRFSNTSVVKNASAGHTATWTVLTGGTSSKYDWVTSDRILIQVPKLTKTGLVKKPCRDRIQRMLLHLADEEARKALATKESGEGEGEGDGEGDDSDDESDDEGDDE
jgi:hypothetical protein